MSPPSVQVDTVLATMVTAVIVLAIGWWARRRVH